jgi:hypothetical protein
VGGRFARCVLEGLSLCHAGRFDKFDIRRFLNDLIDRTINLFSASTVMSWSSLVARDRIELPTRGFSAVVARFRGLIINHLQRLPALSPSHTKAHSWHTRSEFVTFLAQSFAERS